MIKRLLDAAKGKAPITAKRSGKWATVRGQYLRLNSVCASCGRTDKLEVHHIVPFHIAPHLELEKSNLIGLCENEKNGINCHLFIGHLGNYSSFNVAVRADAEATLKKLNSRPKREDL